MLTRRLADCGDYVVVTNAPKVKVTGQKEEQIVYRSHSMYPGGLKEIPYKRMKKEKPDEVRAVNPSLRLTTADSFLSATDAFLAISSPADHSIRSSGHASEKQDSKAPS